MRQRLTLLAALLLFASLAAPTLPRLARIAKDDRKLAPLPMRERRLAVFGSFYESVLRLKKTLPPDAAVAITTRDQRDVDTALFLSYYLYPRKTQVYAGSFGLRRYRQRPDGEREPVLLHVDRLASPGPRQMTYGEIRFEDLGDQPLVADPHLGGIGSTIVVPLATSFDGPWPDQYATEATFVNPPDDAARVRLTLMPQQIVKELTIAAGEKRVMRDVVWETFGSMESGWLLVSTSKPLRASFYFVNRGRGDATRLPLVSIEPQVDADFDGEKLWLLNPRTEAVTVQVGEEVVTVPPRTQLTRPLGGGAVHVEGDVFAFTSTKDAASGRTRFVWP